MDWAAKPAEEWERLTEQEWDSLVIAEQEQDAVSEQEGSDEAMLEEEEEEEEEEEGEEAAAEAMLADAEIGDEAQEEEEMAPPPPSPPVPIDVWSLRAAQALATNLGGGATIRLRAVAVNNAAAMKAVLLAKQKKQKQLVDVKWVIPALDNLTALARVDMLLTLGIEAHLPIIINNLHSVQYLVAFRDWTWELQTAATAFGGKFKRCKRVKAVCQSLRKVIAGALGHRRRRTEDWMMTKLIDGLSDLKALKASIAFFERKA